jgi:hypothetical protein
MKWIRTITGVVENVVSMFRQVDTLIQRIHAHQYIAKVTYQNGVYKINVVDREGNAVDGAIVLVWIDDVSATMSNTVGGFYFEPSTTIPDGYKRMMWEDSLTPPLWRNIIMRIGKNGIKLKISNNSRATLKACVLGIEQGV